MRRSTTRSLRIQARDRPFAARNWRPDKGVAVIAPASIFPANVDTPVACATGSAIWRGYYAADPSCDHALTLTVGSGPVSVPVERRNGAAAIFNPSERLNAPACSPGSSTRKQPASHGTMTATSSTFPLGRRKCPQTTFQQQRSLPLTTSPFYPASDLTRTFGIDGTPLNVYWSAVELGPRTISPITEQWNLVAGLRGVARWADIQRRVQLLPQRRRPAIDRWLRCARIDADADPGTAGSSTILSELAVDRHDLMAVDREINTAARQAISTTISACDFLRPTRFSALTSGPVSRPLAPAPAMTPSANIGPGARVRRCPQSRFLAVTVRRATYGRCSPREHSSPPARWRHRRQARSLQRLRRGTTNPAGLPSWQNGSDIRCCDIGAAPVTSRPAWRACLPQPLMGITPGNLSDPARCPSRDRCRTETRSSQLAAQPALQPTLRWCGASAASGRRHGNYRFTRSCVDPAGRPHQFLSVHIFAQCPNGVTRPDVLPDPPRAGTARLSDASGADRPGRPVPHQPGQAESDGHRLERPVRGAETGLGLGQADFTGTHTHRKPASAARRELPQHGQSLFHCRREPRGHSLLAPLPQLDWNDGPWAVTVTENFQTGGYDQSPGPGTGTQLRTIGVYDLWNVGVSYAGLLN